MGFWELDRQSGQITGDAQTFRLHGLEPTDRTVDREFLLQRVHRSDRECVRRATDTALSAGGDFSVAYRVVRAEEGVRWLIARGRFLRDVAPQAVPLRGMVFDITEENEKQAEQRFSTSRAEGQQNDIEAIYNAARVGLCLLDRELRYLHVNRLLAEMNGLPPAEHIGKTVREVAPDFAPKAEIVAQEVFRTGKPVLNVEFNGTRPAHGGAVRHWIGQWLPHRNRNGEVVGINVVAEDVTDRREIQGRLARTEKLAALGRLGGGVAHELRTPLGAIKNAAYFLNMAIETPTPEVKEALGILNNEVKTCERIVAELLDFGRARPPTLERVDLNRTIRQALQRAHRPEAVDVELQLAARLPAVQADPAHLAQIFGNLIFNAFQAMPAGGRLVIRSSVENRDWVAVSVTDTGTGIPASEIPRLFEPLYTTKSSGIGLGLAISRTHVENHGGTIAVQSAEGKGSTFSVRFPVGEPRRDR